MLQDVAAALRGGCRLLQYRDKDADAAERLRRAEALRRLCDEFSATLLINDDVELARLSRADGVHLGRDDGDLAAARAHLGPQAIIGASCYADFALARDAAAAGADYVAFGAVFSSPTKPEAPPAALDLFARCRRELGLPACAIGGITPSNASAVIDAGAELLAVISDLFSAPDICARATAYQSLFKETA
ncbi:MAG TPA: thiamine phosphate synthase [Rhodocyclaceae bacterium]|nr:thiamine phosphate synthase [Rhodocyclaceae bacterium]